MPRSRIRKKTSRLLLPFGLSLDKEGIFDGHTKGFFTQHNRVVRRAIRIAEENELARTKMAHDAERGVVHDYILENILRHQAGKNGWRIGPRLNVGELMDAHRVLANKSPFFMKRVSSVEILARKKLVRAGIAVEQPIEDLGKLAGTKHMRLQLFKRAGKEIFTRKTGPRIPASKWGELVSIVTRMHLAGVAHNHLHLGNWIVGKRNKLTIIDLEKARVYSTSPVSQHEFLERYADDLRWTGLAHAWLRKAKSDNIPEYRRAILVGIELALHHHAKHMKIFNATPEKVISFGL